MKDILVCIAHHHSPERLQYLLRVLKELATYQGDLDVIIDTNVEGLRVEGENVEMAYHIGLEHPFHLTWMHRRHFKEQIENYRWFMYLEDDILLPWVNFVRYKENFESLWLSGAVPAFVRIEEFEGSKYIVDVTCKQLFAPITVGYNHQVFVELPFPYNYHAFWILPHHHLKANIGPEFDRPTDSRELAASYPTWQLRQRPFVEMDGSQIRATSFAYHLTNGYAKEPNVPWAKIKVEDIFE